MLTISSRRSCGLSDDFLPLLAFLGLVTLSPSSAVADGVSTGGQTMCQWVEAQSALIRDTIFIDGGALTIMTDSTPTAYSEVNMAPTFYLNLTSSFSLASTSNNYPTFETITKSTNNIYDGFMIANDYGFILYGGYFPYSALVTSFTNSNQVSQYVAFLQGSPRNEATGYKMLDTTNGTTTYIGSGGGVNARQTNMSYYFSGLHNIDWDRIEGPGGVPGENAANVTSPYLITVDLNSQIVPVWDNKTITNSSRARVNPEMVFVPVGKDGVLVVVGGVLFPEWIRWTSSSPADQIEESIRTGTDYVYQVDVFDIATSTWYLQNTTGDYPPAMTQHCSTISSASDGSSHQIYVYGGYSGQALDPASAWYFYDDVYILSLPSFQWVHAYTPPTKLYGRKSHNCVQVLPDQLFIIGGVGPSPDVCLQDGFMKIFNLNTLEFQDTYDPTEYTEYQVPDKVVSVIGGGATGGATKTAPEQWAHEALQTVFASPLGATAPTWYPYTSATTSSTTTSTSTAIASHTSTPGPGIPTYVWPLIGAIIGLLLIVGIGCTVFYCMYRRPAKPTSVGGSTGYTNSGKAKASPVKKWLYGINPDTGDGTNTSEEGYPPTDVDESLMSTVSPMSEVGPFSHSGNANPYFLQRNRTIRHELPATSILAELDGVQASNEKKNGVIEQTVSVSGPVTPNIEIQDSIQIVRKPIPPATQTTETSGSIQIARRPVPTTLQRTVDAAFAFPALNGNVRNTTVQEHGVLLNSPTIEHTSVLPLDIRPDSPVCATDWRRRLSSRRRKA